MEMLNSMNRAASSNSLAMEGRLLSRLSKWSTGDLKRLARELRAKVWPDAFDRRLLRLALVCHAENDPEGFLLWMGEEPAGKESHAAIEHALALVLDRDIDIATELMWKLPPSIQLTDPITGALASILSFKDVDRDQITWQLAAYFDNARIDVMAHSDPGEALKLAADHGGNVTTLMMAIRTYNIWLENDPDAAIASAQHQPDNAMRRRFVSALWQAGLAEKHPEKAAQLLKESGMMNSRIVKLPVEGWTRKNPDAALAFTRTIANAETRGAAFAAAGESLAVSDPERAIELLTQIGSVELQTDLLETVGNAVAGGPDPAKAIAIAAFSR